MSLLWPSRRFVSRVNPQGAIAARLGSTCLNEVNNILYVKSGGGNTQFGWYPVPMPSQMSTYMQWGARSGAPLTMSMFGSAIGALGSVNSGGGIPEWNVTGGVRSILALAGGVPMWTGFTSVTIGGYNWWRLGQTALSDLPGAASPQLAGPPVTPANFVDFDCMVRILTSVPVNQANAQPDNNLTGVRHWGLVVQNNTVIPASNEVNSETLHTAFPNGQGESMGIRWSTVTPDAGWRGAVCSTVPTQTLTPGTLAAAPVFTQGGQLWTLRIRRVTNGATSGLVFFSVNDGTEQSLPISQAVTGNGTVLTVAGSVMTLDGTAGARKTLGMVNGFLLWGQQ
jgi:hypothetical protein